MVQLIYLLLIVFSFFFLIKAKNILIMFNNIAKIEKEKWIEKKAIVRDSRIGETKKNRCYFFADFKENNKEFGVKKISFYPANNAHTRSIVRQMEINEEVNVYHHPKLPHLNVLIPPQHHRTSFYVIKALFLFILLFFSWLYILVGL